MIWTGEHTKVWKSIPKHPWAARKRNLLSNPPRRSQEKKKCVQLGIKKECFEDPKQAAPQKGGDGAGTFSYPVTLPTQVLQ